MPGHIVSPTPPWQPLEPNKPYDPYSGDMYNQLMQNWEVNPDDYLGQFKGYYGDIFDTMQGGLSDWDNMWKQYTGDMSKGVYNSDLLNRLTSRITSNLENPDASQAMGLAQDRMAGSDRAAREQLSDQQAGWGRSSGVYNELMKSLEGDLAKNRADTYRQIGMDTERNAITDAAGLEKMKGGFYGDQLDYLSKMYGLAPGMLSSKAAMYGNFPGLLEQMGGMMKYQGNLESQAQNQQFANLNQLNALEENKNSQTYANQQQYAKDMDKWKQKMQSYQYTMQNQYPNTSNPNMSWGNQPQQPQQPGGNWNWW